jgi:ribosomal protein S18 acetylase RimI-like enzyme
MTAAFCDASREKGATRAELSVNDDNGRAIAFYERAGWRQVHRHGPTIVYERDLVPSP